MRKFLFIPLFTILLLSCKGGEKPSLTPFERGDGWQVQALQRYMDDYPQSQLRDVYKFCFQDYFGLEHIITDSLSIAAYIQDEIDNTADSEWAQPRFVYPLLDSNYYRVDIGYVRDGTIPLSTLVHAMLETSRHSAPVDNKMLADWGQRWHQLLALLDEVTPQPLNLETDRILIDSLLNAGHYALHHSKHFNNTYHQHYRIVSRKIIKELTL